MQMDNFDTRELNEAFLSAFDKDALGSLLSTELGMKLEEISKGGRFGDVVGDVLETAHREGWLAGLVDASLVVNPGNRNLRRAAGSFYKQTGSTASEPVIESIAQYGEEVSQELVELLREIEFLLWGGRRERAHLNGNGLIKRLTRIEEKVDEMHIQIRKDLDLARAEGKGKEGRDWFQYVLIAFMITLVAIAAWGQLF